MMQQKDIQDLLVIPREEEIRIVCITLALGWKSVSSFKKKPVSGNHCIAMHLRMTECTYLGRYYILQKTWIRCLKSMTAGYKKLLDVCVLRNLGAAKCWPGDWDKLMAV
uniref:Uncharacterized protein n=1 Tax=Opuntia streptacantha TaxID=393608 RepID=A0A7C9AZ89_OPUST